MTPPTRADAAAVKSLFVRAFLLRAAAAIAIHYAVSEDLFAPDQRTYHGVAAQLAAWWSGESLFYPPMLLQPGPRGYFYIVAVVYYVLGPERLLPKLLNALIGAWTVPVAHDLALRVTGNAAVAYRTAQYTTFFPSLILWSALNIRDVWVILLILLLCREALVLQERFSVRSLVLLGAGVMAIVQFRDYILFPVTLPIVVSFFVRQRQHLLRNTVIGMIAVVAVIYADQSAGSGRRLRTLDLEQLSELRYWHTRSAGSQFEQADISTPGKALLFLPQGLALFLLAPFPWMLGSVRQILAIPETLFFYSLLPSMFGGLKHLLTERLSSSLMIVLLTAGMTFGYALGEGNAGTAYRHRAQMLTCYLLFAAAGRERRRRVAAGAPQLAPSLR